MEAVLSKTDGRIHEDWMILVMGIWANRNTRIFEGKEKEATQVIEDQLCLQEAHRKAFKRTEKETGQGEVLTAKVEKTKRRVHKDKLRCVSF